MLDGVCVVLNAAGPFATIAAPLLDACLATGTHYLDITGESDAIEATAALDAAARAAGVMLLPGVGFDVVASDCLAVHVARRQPGGTRLRIGFDGPLTFSPGSVRSSIEQLSRGVVVRRNAALASVAPATLEHRFDFGEGPEHAMAVSLGDVASAWRSTGIPNIECYLRTTPAVWGSLMTLRYWGWALATPPWQAALKAQAGWFARGPSESKRHEGWATLVAEVTGPDGRLTSARLRTREVYAFTALSAVAVARRVVAGDWRAGFQTPATAYGPDFVLGIDGTTRTDLA